MQSRKSGLAGVGPGFRAFQQQHEGPAAAPALQNVFKSKPGGKFIGQAQEKLVGQAAKEIMMMATGQMNMSELQDLLRRLLADVERSEGEDHGG